MTMSSRCMPTPRLLAELAHPVVRGGICEHLEGCVACRDRVASVERTAASVRDALDCDGALLLLAWAQDTEERDLARLWIHYAECPVCRDVTCSDHEQRHDSSGRIHGSVDHEPPVSADPAQLPLIERSRFTWGSELGRGGMGRVTEVYDRRLGRTVVIKEPLIGDHSTWTQRRAQYRRLEHEARITARLDHPAIVAVHEAGRWATGEPFYAMRRISGRPLDEAIASADGLADRLGLLPHVIAATEAIAYAHAQGIIHRDLKPHNIVVSAFGETVVIDWGLGKELTAAEPVAGPASTTPSPRDATIRGRAVGTPAYMPPEQANGEAVDEQADVYALGAILYHVISGFAPYTDRPGSTEILRRVRRDDPTPLTEQVPQAPKELASIVDKAMRRDSADRFANSAELAQELRSFQRGQFVRTHHYTTWQLLSRLVRRHRAVVLSGLGLLFGLGVMTAVSFDRITQHAARALRAEGDARVEARKAREAEAYSKAMRLKAVEGRRGAIRAQRHAEREAMLADQAREDAERAARAANLARLEAEAARRSLEQANVKLARAERDAQVQARQAREARDEAENSARELRRQKAEKEQRERHLWETRAVVRTLH